MNYKKSADEVLQDIIKDMKSHQKTAGTRFTQVACYTLSKWIDQLSMMQPEVIRTAFCFIKDEEIDIYHPDDKNVHLIDVWKSQESKILNVLTFEGITHVLVQFDEDDLEIIQAEKQFTEFKPGLWTIDEFMQMIYN